MVLQLQSERQNASPKQIETEVLHYLLDKQIPFSNYTPQVKHTVAIPEKSYWSIWNILFDVFYAAVLLALGYIMLKVFFTRAYR